jgi:oxygen-independent coproporphyrinogen-3 oxidase|nr:radical SAM family heme chaperone HemW [uncultured Blautia sp.]
MRNGIASPIEIYIHIPFCVKKCDYCDFLSGPSGPEEQSDYVQALLREIDAVKEGKGRSVSSIFIGGGTPSVLDAGFIGEILNRIRNKFQIQNDAEITIEANPGTADYGKLQAYRDYGINRLSIGLQSPDDRELKILGRIHNYEQFLETYKKARKAGFDNINVDLMSAIPDQTYKGWEKNLRTVAELEPEHISAYSLIIEEGTPFAARQLNLPDEDTEYNMYEATARILKEYGYKQYEISNYAKRGMACRHNVGYWTRQDYLGFGLGASSLYGKERFSNTADRKKYLENSFSPELIREREPILSREDEMAEFMFLGLRMTEGVARTDFEQIFGCCIEQIYGDVLKKYESMGLLQEKNGRIFLSRAGIHVSNSVMADFLL